MSQDTDLPHKKGPFRAFLNQLKGPPSFIVLPLAMLILAPFSSDARLILHWQADAPSLLSWLTAHLTHWDTRHLVTNLVGCAALYACITQLRHRILIKTWWLILGINIVMCDLYLAFAYERSFYVGASSWLYGLWLIGALWLCQFGIKLGYVLLGITLISAAKPLFELPETLSIPTAYEMHLVALITSFLSWIVVWKTRWGMAKNGVRSR